MGSFIGSTMALLGMIGGLLLAFTSLWVSQPQTVVVNKKVLSFLEKRHKRAA